MQIVITIDEKDYNDIMTDSPRNLNHYERLIVNGTPLPKGHGRLIDADILRNEMEKDPRRAMSFVDLEDFVLLAPTIIEKDKEQKDDNT